GHAGKSSFASRPGSWGGGAQGTWGNLRVLSGDGYGKGASLSNFPDDSDRNRPSLSVAPPQPPRLDSQWAAAIFRVMKSVIFAVIIFLSLILVQVVSVQASSLYDIPLKDIDGKPTSLAAYKGKVLLIVNVASKCGNTPQYAALEAMQKKYESQGFTVLGFPCNDFAGQE